MQVKRVHMQLRSNTQVCKPLSTGTLWYLLGINHCIIGLSTRCNLSCVLLTSSLFLKRSRHHVSDYEDTIKKSFMEFYKLNIKFLRKIDAEKG